MAIKACIMNISSKNQAEFAEDISKHFNLLYESSNDFINSKWYQRVPSVTQSVQPNYNMKRIKDIEANSVKKSYSY